MGQLAVSSVHPTSFVSFGTPDGIAASGLASLDNSTLGYSSETSLPYALDTEVLIPGSVKINKLWQSGGTVVGVGDVGAVVVTSSDAPGQVFVYSSGVASSLKNVVEYDGVWIAVGSGDTVIRSEDDGVTWSEITTSSDGTTFYGIASSGDGQILITGTGASVWYSDDSGATFSELTLDIGTENILYSCSFSDGSWVIGGGPYLAVLEVWEEEEPPDPPYWATSLDTLFFSIGDEDIRVILNNKIAAGSSGLTYVIADGLGSYEDNTVSFFGEDAIDGYYDSELGIYFIVTSSGGIYYTSDGVAAGDWGTFLPLSDDYRANDYVVLNGYSILIGTSEYDSEEGWQYNSRRIRWTSPGTLADFASTGSGAGDLNGRGNLICGAVVNERLVLFESESISAIVPTGIVDDPWNYEKIHEGLWSLSNPVVANDKCYFIGSDGLVYITNGLSVSTLNTPFDLTAFTDFDRKDRVVLAYSSELQSLLIFFETEDVNDERILHCVHVESGAYSVFVLRNHAIGSGAVPKTVVSRNDNYLSSILVGYVNSDDAPTEYLILSEMRFGGENFTDFVSGITQTAHSTKNYYMDLQTGEFDLVDEAVKSSIKHILIDVYSDVADAGEIGVQVRSSEDAQWWSANDFNGVFTIIGGTLTAVGTALSNLIATGNSGAPTDTFTLPCLASQARVYLGSTLQALNTDYTITGTKEITLSANLAHGVKLYAYWENEPEIRVKVNDLFLKDGTDTYRDGEMSRLVSITNWNTGVVSGGAGEAVVTHVPAETVSSVGSSQLSIGVNKSVEGAQIRIIVVPRTDVAGTLKVTGISIGHVPTRASRRVS